MGFTPLGVGRAQGGSICAVGSSESWSSNIVFGIAVVPSPLRAEAQRVARRPGEDEILGDAGQFLGYQKRLPGKYGLPPIARDDLNPAAESAVIRRMLENGDTPKEWTVVAWRARDGIYAVVLKGEGGVRVFTVVLDREDDAVRDVTEV